MIQQPRILPFSELQHWTARTCEFLGRPLVVSFDEQPRETILKPDEAGVSKSQAYIQHSEAIWDKHVARHGGNLWNGRVCTIQSIEVADGRLTLGTGTCGYKDIIFKQELGIEAFVKSYGPETFDVHGVTGIVPITETHEVILGEVGKGTIQTPGCLDIIGGTLNRDEHSVESFTDIAQLAAAELREETSVSLEPGQLRLASLGFYDGRCYVLFLAQTHSREFEVDATLNDELAAVHRLSLSSISQTKMPTTRDVAYLQTYADSILPSRAS
ncbi:MAG: hypothetical protein AAF799_01140 [Myxococcota bacterium]